MSKGQPGLEVMDVSSAEAFVIDILRSRGPMSTMEIEKLARDDHKKCPDQTVIFLTKMKKKGLIKGEASLERRGWVWWVP
jgi:predicted transcriptional regulator